MGVGEGEGEGEGKVRFMDQYPMLFTLPTPEKLRPLS